VLSAGGFCLESLVEQNKLREVELMGTQGRKGKKRTRGRKGKKRKNSR